MAKTVSAAMAKAQFSALTASVEHRGERYIIERRGKPVAALVSVEDLERLGGPAPGQHRPLGALALVGAWGDVPESEIDAFIEEIYTSRDRDLGRQVDLEA